MNHPLFVDYAIPFAICVGKIQAGIWASTVAEALVLEGRYGVGIGEDLDRARSELEAAVAETAIGDEWLQAHPPLVEWWGARFEPAAIPADHALVSILGSAFAEATGNVAPVRGMPYGADMHLLINQAGIPAVLFGPGDVRVAHAPDEFCADRRSRSGDSNSGAEHIALLRRPGSGCRLRQSGCPVEQPARQRCSD